MKGFIQLLAWLLLVTLLLSAFELVLALFHAPLMETISDPILHAQTWQYLLKQHYVTFIESDLFSLHEKRHLLDVKRLFDSLYRYWLMAMGVTLLGFILLGRRWREKKKILCQVLVRMGWGIHFLFMVILIFFPQSFGLLHQLLFPTASWFFPPDSLLIRWFPLHYFMEFFGMVLVVYFGLFLGVRRILLCPK